MNKVFIRGLLSKDVELKTTQNNKSVARFNVAVRRDFKKEDGTYDSDFINCLAFGSQAEMISKYFHKGSGIIILGHIQTGSYTKDDGTKVFTTDVIVENIEFDRKETKKEESTETTTQTEIVSKAMSDEPFAEFGQQMTIDSESDLPF